jgi:hypothetical protein
MPELVGDELSIDAERLHQGGMRPARDQKFTQPRRTFSKCGRKCDQDSGFQWPEFGVSVTSVPATPEHLKPKKRASTTTTAQTRGMNAVFGEFLALFQDWPYPEIDLAPPRDCVPMWGSGRRLAGSAFST